MELFKKKDKQDIELVVVEPQSNVALEEAPKKKNLATMDVKDLFKSSKPKKEKKPRKGKDSDEDEVAANAGAPASNAPKQSLATMDVKDLIKLIHKVVEVEFVLTELLFKLHSLFLVKCDFCLFDKRKHIAHTEDS